MDLYQNHADVFAELQAELGDDCPTMTRGAVTYKIIPGSASNSKPLEDGGFSDVFDLSFDMLFSEFSALFGYPDPTQVKNALLNSPIMYQNQKYKVMMVTIAPNAVLLTIGANSFNQKA